MSVCSLPKVLSASHTGIYLPVTSLVHFAYVVSQICLGWEDLRSIAWPLSKISPCQDLVSLWLSQKLRRASWPAVLLGRPPSPGCKLCVDCQGYSPGLTQLINSPLSKGELKMEAAEVSIQGIARQAYRHRRIFVKRNRHCLWLKGLSCNQHQHQHCKDTIFSLLITTCSFSLEFLGCLKTTGQWRELSVCQSKEKAQCVHSCSARKQRSCLEETFAGDTFKVAHPTRKAKLNHALLQK